MSINYDRLRELVAELDQDTYDTPGYTWLNLARELLRLRDQQDQQPAHPATLVTVEDYENAPEGTIIAHNNEFPWVKEGALWRSPVFWDSSNALAASVLHGPCTVLRWGQGK